ncbi:MAG: bifunctional UDP-3-O-[3-hydroxymyristoyl] N-acetylglucosamine deacetylase/3-hydroxyacyl-ACP dehydratase [Bacteroidaceae bacterium]|jgi:UDP-3-O-[3-hydroxymyristoyl] N-acetylglucosamine deacetylase/3-hydroxyacyl-[acyl-carrier-protein] dehydratase|nr:bifunctional UDP-3-O-[3-hydroxymyristoyl] N-acetylglucosamine deacetylase/3-hydroxyacyl-ACP dehydratase [Bacteroidaceae bacterium]MBP8602253.1 bifunctional UDP-3-O-[3-hydroxymyristoyl] N-acetylglucosamine deacetylase/3-hydroxyacyl-ACP dehydratase [Bacteroidaceae bacterium]OPZ48831.1 MAG: UDP-3-O-(3-hydroxymyristoyl) N-acetylglucosamine deacetylase [Bacteroidetes bacterium ADurb.BinA104]HOD68589.1 bifunctional UDP-3-O-[3-hydroxymyristoyl] N-acetylglucosamine deacetylase/3-hydroxyacyl-ACP dehyd
MYKQKTLKEQFSLSGKGLHTGLELTVTFKPAPADYGYKIQRIDLDSQPIIEAVAENVRETQRGTVLFKGNTKVSTVEHALAALYAAGIDNCHIDVNGPEFPILDGSSIKYVESIQHVGIKDLDAIKDYYIVKSKIEVRDESTGSSIILLPDDTFSVNVLISYDSKILDNQYASLDDMSDFPTEIASSRTFVFVREIEPLLAAGLIKGGDLDNAIVIYEREMSQERYDKICEVMDVPKMDATKLGYIMHKPLTFCNEPARHKLLDIIGDLALVGKPIKGRIIATRPGHTINNKFARILRKNIKLNDVQAPAYNPAVAPVMNLQQIMATMPHRFPMLLLDKVITLTDLYAEGVKNVTNSEIFFLGHFPGHPIMPGVLIVEAMAQLGGMLALQYTTNPGEYEALFAKIDNTRFRHSVVPGDTMLMRVVRTAPVRHSMLSLKGYTFVADKLVAESEFMVQIIKKKRIQ